MKKQSKKRFVSLFLAFVVMFSVFPTGIPVFATEIIVSNTFEVHYEGWTTDFGSLTTLTSREGEGMGGSRGMKVTNRQGPENFAISDKGFYLWGGETYRYSIFVRHEEPQAEMFTMTLQWMYYEEDDRAESTVIAEQVVRPGEWTEITARYTTPDRTHNTTIILATDSAADFWFDEFTVTQRTLQSSATEAFANTPANVGLKDIYANHFRVGNILNGNTVNNAAIRALLMLEYNSITAENEHKPDQTMNRAQSSDRNIVAQFNTGAARINAFAAENGIPIREHAISWHGQTPDWFYLRATGSGQGQFDTTNRRQTSVADIPWASREVMNQRLESYIRSKFALYASQYPTLQIYAVDVVNEYVLVRNNSGQPRLPGFDGEGAGGHGAAPGRSAWTAIYHGTSDNVSAINWSGTVENTNNWLWRAFHYTRMYAPADTKLFYNDYNEFDPTKRTYIINSILRPLFERGLVDGMGMQGHLDADQGGWSSWPRFRDAMDAYSDISVPGRGYLEVQITELDISRGHNSNTGQFAFTEAQQATKYAQIFNHAITVNARGRGQFTAICIWTINDAHSWIGANQPAIHRADNTRKPAYHSVAAIVPPEQWGDGNNPEFRYNSMLRGGGGSGSIYNMQTDPQWSSILSATAHNIMHGTTAEGTRADGPPRELRFPVRSGTSQGLRIRAGELLSRLVPANAGVKIEYTGRLSVAGSSQIRIEGTTPAISWTQATTGASNSFTHEVIISREQLQMGNGDISLGATPQDAGLTITGIRITAVDDDGRDRPNEWGWFFHHPFEGSTHGWQPRGGTTVEPSGRTFALGAESLAIRNRSATWHGASFDLTPRAFRAGETFSFSVCAVYLEGGGAEEELSLTLEHTVGGETRWVNIARGFADRGEWVQLANRSFAIPAGATNLRLVVESPTNADITFYIDEAIGAVSNTNIAAPSGVNQPRPERRPTITPTPTPTPTPTLTPTPTPDDLAQIFASITPAPALISATNNNPIMTQRFSADPNAMVYNDRVYVFSTNDVIERDGQGNIVSNTFMNINTINLISSADMVNWTDHGAIRAAGSGGAATFASQSWAPSAVHKNISGQDRFFLYFCNNASGIVVLTAPTPIGPWTSPRNNMLINNSTPGVNRDEIPWLFDPAVFVDDDGQGYLYFGGGIPGGNNPTAEQFRNPRSARVIRLSDDMINTQSSAVMIDAPFMFEASEMFKHGDTYYFSYSTNFAPQLPVDGFEAASIRYMTSSSPMGPFTYRGTVLPRLGHTLGQWGNSHHDIIEFRGQHYIFYHSADLVYARYGTRDFGYRSTHVDILNINPDGTIQQVTPTRTGVPQIGTLNPYETVRASTIARQAGINVRGVGDTVVTDIDRGDWISVRGAGFTSGAESVTVRVSSVDGAAIRIARGDPQGQLVGFVEVPVTGSAFVDITVPVTVPVGTHDLYFLFSGSMEFESWMFGNDGSGVIEWPDRPPAPSTINGTNILTLTAATIIGGEAGPIINADPLPTRDGASVVFEQRAADWNGLDIRTGEPNNLRAGDEIVISGRISNHPVPAGTQMIMIQAGGNWTMLAQANATLSAPFELRHILRESDIAADVNFRIQTNAAGAEIPFVIDHILITRPIPAVCGVDGYVCNLPECELCNPDCGNCGSYPCKCIRVTFNLNGGTFANPENATRIITPGDNISTLPRATASVFSLEGYRFIGWFRDTADESTRWRDNNEVNGGVTLYAKWVVTPHDFVLGNVNHDGRITSADATAIARYLAEHNVEDICLLAADLNGDGDVCIADVILLARWLVGHDVSHLLAH